MNVVQLDCHIELSVAPNPDTCPSGTALREARRHRGLSQADLAGLLNISQSRVSAWERGYDEVPRRLRNQVIDIMGNKSGVLDPLIRNLIRHDPYLAVYLPTVTDGLPDFKCIQMAAQPSVEFLRPIGGYYGRRISRYFDLGWYKEAQDGRPLREKLMFDVEREVVTSQSYGREHVYRVRSHHMLLEFDGHQRLALVRHTMRRKPTFEAPKVHASLFIDELD